MKNLIGTTLGQYEIREQVGQGGMAYVFKAYQPSLNRFVAVKVLSPNFAEDADFTERFQREAQAVAHLNHPNILHVHDFGTQDHYNYLVMRYVEGSKTLDDLIRDGIPAQELINYILQVADALNYAHERGVIHRDVKPGNILIDDKWALLSDFGLVKLTETASQLTRTGTGMGTPAYMSPEQVAGLEVDRRTDIYALGIILYRILTGTVPHNAPTPLAIMVKRRTEPITPPHQIKPDTPESFEHVVMRSLATKPDERYSTATDFAEALRKAKTDPAYREATLLHLRDETIVSRDKVLPFPSKRRNLSLIMGGMAAIIVVAGALIFFLGSLITGDDSPTAQSVTQIETPDNAQVSADITATNTPVPPTDTPTPIPLGTPSALVQTDLEVRSGPGNEYTLVGYLPEGATAEITGRDKTRQWWQIKTSLTSAGVGWIQGGADFAIVTDTDNVPIALAPPTSTATFTPIPPTSTPTVTPTPDTPISTPTSTPGTPTSTPTPTPGTPTATPIPTRPAATATPAAPLGQFELLKPASLDDPSFGLTEFEWQWGGQIGPDQGFEVRVWREGEPPAGVHNAVLDNKDGTVQTLGNNTYRLVTDITEAPGVLKRRGEYNWTVVLVQIEPEYKDLGIQAPPGLLRFEPPGSSGGGGGGNGSGGGGGGVGGGD